MLQRLLVEKIDYIVDQWKVRGTLSWAFVAEAARLSFPTRPLVAPGTRPYRIITVVHTTLFMLLNLLGVRTPLQSNSVVLTPM